MLEHLTNLATSVSAVAAVLISLYVLRLQLRDRQDVRRDQDREHASRVSCWPDWSKNSVPVLSGGLLHDPVGCVANRTDEPVFGAFVDYRDQSDGHPIRVDVGTIPPGAVKSVRWMAPRLTRAKIGSPSTYCQLCTSETRATVRGTETRSHTSSATQAPATTVSGSRAGHSLRRPPRAVAPAVPLCSTTSRAEVRARSRLSHELPVGSWVRAPASAIGDCAQCDRCDYCDRGLSAGGWT